MTAAAVTSAEAGGVAAGASASADTAPLVRAVGVGKRFRLYGRPRDRLVEWATLGRAKRHREFWAVRGVDLEIRRGEVLGLIGVNGAGKSTLLRTLAGVTTPTEGSVEIRGRIHALIELRAGFNAQLSGRENLRYAGQMLGFEPGYIRDREAEIVAFAGLGEYLDQPMRLYSSGMFARLSFAMMVYLEPDALLIDETLAVGDQSFKRRCFEFIDGFVAGEKHGAMIVSHSMSHIKRLCQRAAWVHEGRLVRVGPADEVIAAYAEFNADREHSGGVPSPGDHERTGFEEDDD